MIYLVAMLPQTRSRLCKSLESVCIRQVELQAPFVVVLTTQAAFHTATRQRGEACGGKCFPVYGTWQQQRAECYAGNEARRKGSDTIKAQSAGAGQILYHESVLLLLLMMMMNNWCFARAAVLTRIVMQGTECEAGCGLTYMRCAKTRLAKQGSSTGASVRPC